MTTLPEPLATLFPKGIDCLSSYFSRSTCDGAVDPRFASCVPRKTVDWIAEYEAVITTPSFNHHEPWLTLMALYGLLGDQSDLNSRQRLSAVNRLMDVVYSGKGGWADVPRFSKLTGARVEVCLRENLVFRHHLKKVFGDGAYHPYRDRRLILADKPSRGSASLEGNTMLDVLVSGEDDAKRRIHILIEAKFLSDVSKDISYLPVCNQIARNIDCAIDLMTDGGSNLDGLNDFWFVLLTPGLFRTRSYGSSTPTPLDVFSPSRSRLFCYKMDDYRDPDILKQELPHWAEVLDDPHWERISKRIGWMTFEDVVSVVCSECLLPSSEIKAYRMFFEERGVMPGGAAE